MRLQGLSSIQRLCSFHAGKWIAFNTTFVDAYWEHHLYGSGYTKVSGADTSQNCHGYSTGKGVWMNGFMMLMADDWKEYTLVNDLPSGSGAVYGDDGHSIKIDSVTKSIAEYTVSISEKFRDSGIYKSSYTRTIDQGAVVELDLKNLEEVITFRKFYKKN